MSAADALAGLRLIEAFVQAVAEREAELVRQLDTRKAELDAIFPHLTALLDAVTTGVRG